MKPSEARKLAKQRIAAWRAQSLQEFEEIEDRRAMEEKNQKPAFRYHSWENRAKFQAHLKKGLDAFSRSIPRRPNGKASLQSFSSCFPPLTCQRTACIVSPRSCR